MKNPEVQHEQEDDQSRETQPKPNHLALLAQSAALVRRIGSQ
jgi:hypothetical protein